MLKFIKESQYKYQANKYCGKELMDRVPLSNYLTNLIAVSIMLAAIMPSETIRPRIQNRVATSPDFVISTDIFE